MKSWILATLVFCGTAQALPVLGGNSGGGGMLTPPEPMDEAELAYFIREEVPQLARMYFNFVVSPYLPPRESNPRWVHFEGDAPEGQEPLNRSAYEKVFLNGPSVLERMETTKISLQTTPCFDPVSGKEKDASADASKNELCFNTKALLNNTPARSLRSHVLALAIHEYSHLKETTEPEAEFIEKWAKLTVAVDGVIFSRIKNEWLGLREESETLVTVRTLAADVMTAPLVPLAFRVSEVAAQVEARIVRAYDLISYSGLSGWDLQQRAKSLVAAVKAQNLGQFKCSLPEVKIAPEKQGCDPGPAGEDRDIVTVNELAQLNDFKFLVPMDDIVRNVKKGDRAALKAELDDLARLLRALFKDLPDPGVQK